MNTRSMKMGTRLTCCVALCIIGVLLKETSSLQLPPRASTYSAYENPTFSSQDTPPVDNFFGTNTTSTSWSPMLSSSSSSPSLPSSPTAPQFPTDGDTTPVDNSFGSNTTTTSWPPFLSSSSSSSPPSSPTAPQYPPFGVSTETDVMGNRTTASPPIYLKTTVQGQLNNISSTTLRSMFTTASTANGSSSTDHPIDGGETCRDIVCPADRYCAIDSIRKKPTCACYTICSRTYVPVCADNYKTYNNECEMYKESCAANVNITKLYDGRCGEGNPTSSPLPNQQNLNHSNMVRSPLDILGIISLFFCLYVTHRFLTFH